MITNLEKIKKHREDGSLMYECVIGFLSKNTEHLHSKRINGKSGAYIYIKESTKYKKDGSIEWRLVYNDFGEVIGNDKGTNMAGSKTQNKRAEQLIMNFQ